MRAAVKTGTNHYSLAFTYDAIAWSRGGWVDLSAYGWLGYDEDEHWRHNLATMESGLQPRSRGPGAPER